MSTTTSCTKRLFAASCTPIPDTSFIAARDRRANRHSMHPYRLILYALNSLKFLVG